MKLSHIDLVKRLFALCILLVVFYILLTFKHFNLSINLPKNIKINLIDTSLNVDIASSQTNLNTREKCDPIRKNYKQYSHVFDGVKYPQYLYLSQNYSIDFDCLNRSSPMKRILAWNKFYGN